jgi:hypothetical protein
LEFRFFAAANVACSIIWADDQPVVIGSAPAARGAIVSTGKYAFVSPFSTRVTGNGADPGIAR